MPAMVFDRHGEPDVMHLKDVPVPEPQDGLFCEQARLAPPECDAMFGLSAPLDGVNSKLMNKIFSNTQRCWLEYRITMRISRFTYRNWSI
jgi:hypothetical protein